MSSLQRQWNFNTFRKTHIIQTKKFCYCGRRNTFASWCVYKVAHQIWKGFSWTWRKKQHGLPAKIRVSRSHNDFERSGVLAVGQYSAGFSRRMKFIVQRTPLSVITSRKTRATDVARVAPNACIKPGFEILNTISSRT